jgi:serine/threonine protein kinase
MLVFCFVIQGVVNRDIKLENSLLTNHVKPLLKICDFGYSKVRSFRYYNFETVPQNFEKYGLVPVVKLIRDMLAIRMIRTTRYRNPRSAHICMLLQRSSQRKTMMER